MNATPSNSLQPARFEDGKPMVIAGLRGRYTPATAKDIPAQWQRFAPHIGNIPGEVGKTTYGVCFSQDSAGGFDYISGVEVSQSGRHPADFTSISIPAKKYAVFTHQEHVSKLSVTLDAVWRSWLPASGRECADSPMFERYGEGFDPRSGMGDIEVWIPIKA